jgi:hypothetical protein
MNEILLDPLFWVKIIALLLTAGYSIFALVIINQIRTMDKIIHLPPTKIILTGAFINLLLGAFFFLLSLVIL